MARDKFHFEFRHAIENEGWKITDDPLVLKSGKIQIHIDLGAELLIGAEKDGEKIAIEIKTFGNPSFITAFYEAVGKFIVYRNALEMLASKRVLYLAIPKSIFERFENEPLVKRVFEIEKIKIIVYNQRRKNILKWIK
ncbi:MAG: element excision factor XisH family protein [Saprospiraceae bacterium]